MNLNFNKKHFALLICMFAINSAQLFGAATIVPDDEDIAQRVDDKKRSEPKTESKENKEEARDKSDLVSWTEISKKKPVSALVSKSVEDKAKALPKDLQKIIGRKALDQYWDSVTSENMEALYFALWDDSFRLSDYSLLDFLQSIRKFAIDHKEKIIFFRLNCYNENHEDGTITSTITLRHGKLTPGLKYVPKFITKFPKDTPGQVLCFIYPDSTIKWVFSSEHIDIISTLTLEQIDYIKSLYLSFKGRYFHTPPFFRTIDLSQAGSANHSDRSPLWLINEQKRLMRRGLPGVLISEADEAIHKSLPGKIRANLEYNHKIITQTQNNKQEAKLAREKRAIRCGKISLLLYLAVSAPILAYQTFF